MDKALADKAAQRLQESYAKYNEAMAAGDTEQAARIRDYGEQIRQSLLSTMPPTPTPVEEPLGLAGLFGKGFDKAIAAGSLAGAALTGDFSGQAKNVTESLQPYAVPKELKEAQKAFVEESQMISDAEHWYSPKALGGAALGILEMGKQVITNPKGLLYMTAEQAANMAPGILGNLAGLAAASATGVGAPAALAMAVGAGFAGQVPIEAGSELTGLIGNELARRKLELNEANVQSILIDKKFMDSAVKSAAIKGATTAAIDSITTVGAGRLAAAPERAAMKEAKAALAASGVAADDAIVGAAAKDILANRKMIQKLSTGAKAVGLDVAGGGASEAGGQLAAYGKVDPNDVFQEMLGELGGAGLEIPALAKTMGEKALRGAVPPAATPPGTTAPPATTLTAPPGTTAPPATTLTAPPGPPIAADFGLTEDEFKARIAGYDNNIEELTKTINDIDVKLATTAPATADYKALIDQKKFVAHTLKVTRQQRRRYAPFPPKKQKVESWRPPLEDVRQVIAAAGDEKKPGDWSKALETAFPHLAGNSYGRNRGILLQNLKDAGHISGQTKGRRAIIPGEHWNNPILEPKRKTPKAAPKKEEDTLLADVDFTNRPDTEEEEPDVFDGLDEDAQRQAAEDAQRQAAEAEAQRLADEEAQRQAAEAEAQRQAAEDAQRQAATEEAAEESDVTYEPQEDKFFNNGQTYTFPWMRATYKDGTVIDASDGKAGITLSAPRTIGQFTFDTVYAEPDRVTLKGKTPKGKKYKIDIKSNNIDILSENGSKLLARFNLDQQENEEQIRKGLGDDVVNAIIDGKDPRSLVLGDLEGKINGALDAHYKAIGRGEVQTQETATEETATQETATEETATEETATEETATGETPTEEATTEETPPSNYDRALAYVSRPDAKLTVDGVKNALGIKRPEAAQLINQLRAADVIETKGNKNVLKPAQPAPESTGTGVSTTGGRGTVSRKRAAGKPVAGGVGTTGTTAGQPAAGEANVPGALTGKEEKSKGRGKGKGKTQAQIRKEKREAEQAADNKTPYIADADGRKFFQDMVIKLREAGTLPTPVANTLLKRLADDGEVGRPSMTDQTYGEMIDAINKAGRLAEQGGKPEAKPVVETLKEKRNAASTAWSDAVTLFVKSLDKKQKIEWDRNSDVSKLKLNAAQGKLYEDMEELHDEYTKLQEQLSTEIGDVEFFSAPKETLERVDITDPAKLAETADTTETVEKQSAPTLTEDELRNWLKAAPRKPLELLDLIVRTSDNPMYRTIASMLRPLIRQLETKGVVSSSPITTYATKAHGHVRFELTRYQAEAHINLNRTTYKTALHELIHYAFEPMVELCKTAYLNKENNELSKIYEDYMALGNAIGKRLVKLKARGKVSAAFVAGSPLRRLNEALNGIRQTNIFGSKEVTVKAGKNSGKTTQKRTVTTYDIREIFTWALTDDDTALVLDALPSVMGPPLFQKFVSLVRRVIGSPISTQSALTDILDLSRRLGEATLAKDTTIVFNPKKFETEARRPIRIPAPPRPSATPEEQIAAGAAEIREELKVRPPLWQRIKNTFSNKNYEETVRLVQNDRRLFKTIQNAMKLAKVLRYENHPRLGGFTNFYDRIVNSSGKTFKVLSTRFSADLDELESEIRKLAEKTGVTVEETLAKVDRVLKALHYEERRRTLFMLYSPLRDVAEYTITMPNGTKQKVGAATLRAMILDKVRSNTKLSDAEVKKYHDILMALTEPGGPLNRLDPNGISQANMPGEPVSSRGSIKFTTDINNDTYSPLGPRTAAEVASMQALYNAEKADLDPIIKLSYKIIETQRLVDQDSNFWSQGVENLRRLYDWQNYVPLKNVAGVKYSLHHNLVEPRSKRYSPEFKSDLPSGMGGRISEPKNVVLQIQSDAIKASSRLGRQDSTEAVRNAILEGYIYDNKKKRLVIPFSERYKGFNAIQYRGNEWFVYYAPNGNIELYYLTDLRQREALRRTRDSAPMGALMQTLSTGTSFIGKGFTRWNLKFAPKDFIRNVVFGAGIFGLEMGPKKAGEFIARIASRVMNGGIPKGWKVWKLYETGNMAELQRLSTTDPFYKSTFEYLDNGGAITYVQQFAQQGRISDVVNNYKKTGIRRKIGNAQKFVNLMLDCWVQAFEVTVRSVAYDMYKDDLLAKGISEEAAQVSASAQAKELTNFESVGAKANQLAAAFAFFRASSTGSVRTMDALRPLFIKDVKTLLEELPTAVKTDPVALANAEKQLQADKKNAAYTALLALGTGAALYMIARSFAGDDEADRNLVASDKKEQWTRALRIPLSTFGMEDEDGESVLSIPWGFGIGAFMAWGAQVMAWAAGDQSTREFVGNSAQVGMDSFLPLPVARFNPFDPASRLDTGTGILAWVLDSASPTLIRPAVEHLMSINGLGQELFRDSTNSYGDAYATSESVPEVYNQLSGWLEEHTNGAIDMQPTTMYFIMNNYISAFAQATATTYGMFASLIGDKKFSLRQDLPILSTFISRRTGPDASDYARMEKFVTNQQNELKKLENFDDPTRLYNYLNKHPNAEMAVDSYKDFKKQIDKLQEDRNRITRGIEKFESPKERSEAVKYYTDEINRMKRASTEQYNYLIEAEKELKD